MKAIATKIYGAADITADSKVRTRIMHWKKRLRSLPGVCGQDPVLLFDRPHCGVLRRPVVHIREVRLAAGAEFIVMVCGDVMTMPGLPKCRLTTLDIDEKGRIVGLF